MSQLLLDECGNYAVDSDLGLLPCGGCAYCRRAEDNWGRFSVEVDDVIPLGRVIQAVQEQTADFDKEDIWENLLKEDADGSRAKYVCQLDAVGLREVLLGSDRTVWDLKRDRVQHEQSLDPDLKSVVIWRTEGREPEGNVMFLES